MIKRFLMVVVLAALSPNSYAMFGLGPCCPPSVCGTIPCDAGCSGQAITNMGTTFSTDAQSVAQGYTGIANGLQSYLSTVSDAISEYTQTDYDNSQDYTTALDAKTKAILATQKGVEKVVEALFTTLSMAFNQAVKGGYEAKSLLDMSTTYNTQTMPWNLGWMLQGNVELQESFSTDDLRKQNYLKNLNAYAVEYDMESDHGRITNTLYDLLSGITISHKSAFQTKSELLPLMYLNLDNMQFYESAWIIPNAYRYHALQDSPERDYLASRPTLENLMQMGDGDLLRSISASEQSLNTGWNGLLSLAASKSYLSVSTRSQQRD